MGEFVQFRDVNDRLVDNIENGEVDTDVDGVKANGKFIMGMEEFPIFDVNEPDFIGSSQGLRGRVAWETDGVKNYAQQSQSGRSFYIRHNDQLRKIK